MIRIIRVKKLRVIYGKWKTVLLFVKIATSISGNIDIDNDRLRIKVSDDKADFELSIDEDGLQIKTSDN